MTKELTLVEQCVEYVHNNFNTLVYDAKYTYSQMCISNCPLYYQNPNLYGHIQDLMEDFGLDNDLEENWFDDEFIDAEDMFDMYLSYLDNIN